MGEGIEQLDIGQKEVLRAVLITHDNRIGVLERFKDQVTKGTIANLLLVITNLVVVVVAFLLKK